MQDAILGPTATRGLAVKGSGWNLAWLFSSCNMPPQCTSLALLLVLNTLPILAWQVG